MCEFSVETSSIKATIFYIFSLFMSRFIFNSKGQYEIYTCVDKVVDKFMYYIKAELSVVATMSPIVDQGVD